MLLTALHRTICQLAFQDNLRVCSQASYRHIVCVSWNRGIMSSLMWDKSRKQRAEGWGCECLLMCEKPNLNFRNFLAAYRPSNLSWVVTDTTFSRSAVSSLTSCTSDLNFTFSIFIFLCFYWPILYFDDAVTWACH